MIGDVPFVNVSCQVKSNRSVVFLFANPSSSSKNDHPLKPLQKYKNNLLSTENKSILIFTCRGVPLWASNLIGRSFVDAHVTDLQTAPVPFVDGVYDPIDASVWCREVIKALDHHMRKIAKGEIPPPGGYLSGC